MAEQLPNEAANKSKAEGERWNPEESSAKKPGGITNRTYEEERENQEALPTRGTNRDESLGVGDEVESDREERRSER
jgi:hypothetical protein